MGSPSAPASCHAQSRGESDMNNFVMYTDKNIEAEEIAELMDSVGWGRKEEYDPSSILRSLNNFPFIAYIRTDRRHKGILLEEWLHGAKKKGVRGLQTK
jgi:hypothetical protein